MLAGSARFTIDGEQLDAPAGTCVFLPDGEARLGRLDDAAAHLGEAAAADPRVREWAADDGDLDALRDRAG